MANNIWIKRAAKARGVDEETYLKSRMGGNNGQGNEPARSPENIWVKRAAASAGMDTASYLASRALRSGTRSEQSDGAASWSKDRASLWAITHGLVDTEDNLRPTYSVGARNATGNIEAVDMDSDRYMGNLVPTRKDTAPLSDYDGIIAELKMAEEEYNAADKRINDYINQNGIQYKSNPGYQTLIYARNQAWGRYHDLKERKELAKYLVEDRADNFKGQYDANRDVGEITEMTNLAYNDYLNDPTPEKLEYARQLDELLDLYLEKNAAVLDDEGAVATWITKDLAGYMPQFWGQQGSGLKGAAAGGLAVGAATSYIPGVNLGGFVWGARGGYTLGVGKYSYDTMRGAAFRTFINNGVDEETARAAASDEALVSALIEMVDAGVDIATLFTGKIVGTAARKAANVLIRYGINVVSEAAEEAGQELVSISNADRINSGNYDPNAGWFNNSVGLGVDTDKLLGDVITGKNTTARDQALEAAWQGAKLAAMTSGATMVGTGTINTIAANRVGNQIQSSGGGTVRQFIDLGLAAKPNTESYKIASNLEKKLAAGNQISNTEVGWLYRALQEDKVFDQQPTTNRAQTESEVSRENGSTYTLEQRAREAVAERENGTQSAPETLMELEGETVAERNAIQQTQAGAATVGKSRSATDYTAAIKKWTGYGDNGVKTFVTAVEQSGADPQQVRARFQSAYEVGRLGTPRESVELNGDLQQQAYIAGHLDYLADRAKDKANTFKVSNEAGFDRTGAPADVTDTQAEILDMLAKNLGSKSTFDGDQDFNGEIRSDGTVRYSTSFQREIRDENGNVVKTLTVVNHALHELGAHRAMQIAPEATRSFVNKFYGYLMENSPATAATLAERKQQFYGSRGKSLTTDKAFEEVIANEIFPVLYGSNEQQLRESLSRIFNGTDEQVRQIKKGARTFKDVLHDMWQKIKDFAAKLRRKGDTAAALEAEQVAADIKELRDMFENVLKIAAEQVKAKQENSIENRAEQEYNGNNESQLSAKYWKPQLTKKEWNLLNTRMEREIGSSRRVIDDATKWLYADENGTTVFAIYGIGDGTEATPLYASGGKQASADYNKWSNFWEGYLNEPDADRTDFDSWLESVRSEQGYQRSNLYDPAGRAADADNDRVYGRASGRNGDRASGAGKENRSSVITDGKTQFSLKDSTGRTLSPGQQEYFKDSKVRDENGNLKVMYHGTPNGDFSVFKDGSYFTANKEYADRYQSPSASSISTGKKATAPKTFAVYLNIKKPFDITDPTARDIYINEYIKGGNAMGINPDLSDAEYRKIKTVDWTEGEDLRGFLIENEYDYDGLVLDEGADGGYGDDVSYRGQSYVVFSPEQVKGIDNLNPTNDPDFQFSLKSPVEQTKDLLALHNMTEKNLRGVLRLGGFPMPSLAIVKAEAGHSNYGPISVVFGKDTIDPQASSKNKVYGGDAYTPTDPGVYYPMDRDIERSFDRMVWEASQEFAGGEFKQSSPLSSLGYNGESRDDIDEITRRLASLDAVQAAFLSEQGKTLEPVMSEKVSDMDQFGNDALQTYIDRIGQDALIDKFYDHTEDNGKVIYPVDLSESEAQDVREALKEKWRSTFLVGKPNQEELIEKRAQRIDEWRAAKFAMNAWNFYVSGGYTATEVDHEATKNAMRDMIAPGGDLADVEATVQSWVKSKLDGLLGEPGVFNGKSAYTASGNRRKFWSRHDPYTLENIVKAMKNNQQERGGNTFGISAGSLQATATPNYKSVAEIKADSWRLGRVDPEAYQEQVDAVNQQIDDIVSKIRVTGNESYGGHSRDVIGDILKEAATGKKTVDAIVKKFKAEGYNICNQTAQDIQALYKAAAELPTEYFEAKPQRAVGFDEVLAVVVPDDLGVELVEQMRQAGMNVLTYKTGDDIARLEVVNSVDGAQFSLKEQNDLLKENAKLKEVNEALREQFKRTEFAKVDKKSLDKFTKSLLKDYQSGADINEIRDALSDVYTYMANGEDGHGAAWNDLQERAYNVAVSILESASAINDDMYQEYKSLRDRLRNYPISIDKRYDNDIQGYESINDFRRANFGRIKIANDGTPVDIVYSDLANTYPEFFDESEYTTQADQLTHIADVLESLQPYEVNPYSANMRQAATWLASDIIERFYDLPQAKPTFADKQATKLTKQVIKDAKKLENLREKKNERIKELIRNNREKVKATTQKEREKRVAAVKEVKEHYKDKERKASESRKARTLRAKIMRHAQEMSRKLLRPTDKQHIPQKLQGAVAKLLEAINLESNYTYDPESKSYKKNDEGLPSNRTKAFAELRKLYAEMANELVIDPDLLGEDGLLSDVAALADKRIADMTSEELETVYRTLRAVEATVSSANRAFAESRWASIEEAAESIWTENKNKRQVTEYAGPIGWGQKLTGLDMMTPSAFFHRLGESGDAIFRMMRNAQDKHIQLMKAVADFTHKELDAVPVKKWEKELHTVKLGGEDVQLTTAQIMELYALTKRKQAQDHIFMGGILPESVANKGIKKIARAEPVRGIQISEVSEAISKLTEEQKKVADKLQEYASTELSKWGNEAAMQVYNYEKFNEEVYWPIRSNRQEITSTVEKDTQVTSVAGRGFSKNTKPNANTSVKIGSIFDTFATHSSEMATYAAWLAPAEDINRIRNYTFMSEEGGRAGTVKGIIERVHGSRGTQYLQKLLSDIANGVGAGRGNETRMDQIIGNYKASAIGANLRVIIQQPTALLRALDMIDPQHLLTVKNPMSGWKKAKKYAPIAQWKDWGYFDINTGRQMKDVLFETDSALDKAKQFTMAGAGLADSISWGTLWNAVENEVAATRKELNPNTEEFYKAVAARFTEIVDHTQVVDGILQRSQIMRSADGLTKMATSFMGEPTKQYNMVMTALYDFRHTEGKERTIARKRFGRTMTALVISGVVNAMAQSIIDAVRDDDEEKEYWEKWLTAFFGLKGDEETIGEKAKAIIFGSNLANIFNPAGYIPYAKDVVSLLAGYDVSRMDMESIEKTISSWNNLWKAINGEGGYTIQGAAINFIGEAARLFGVPVANIKREIVSFTTMTAQETDSFMMQYYIEKFFTNVNNSSGGSMNILYNAYKEDKDEFEALYARMLKDDLLKTEDKTTAEVIAGKLQSKLVKDLYELYKTDPKAYEEMYDDLVERDFLKTGVKSSDPEKDTFVSTEEHIASAMESLMKKDQGVDKVGDLESRYFGPDQQREYDQKMREIQSSSVWQNATAEQREKVEDNLRGIVLGSDSKMLETIEEGTPYGLDDTEYLLYKLALETVDQPNENGKFGTYTNEEKARAFASMNLGDGEMAFLWGTDQALEAYAYGIDMEKYITFKAAIGNIVADKDRRGNTISGSRRKKIIAYLRSLGVSQKEYWYLLGTEFDLKDDPNYRRYFG